MTDNKYCGQCKHWHKRPFLKQDTMIPIGDCDKIEKGRPFPSCDKDKPFYYDGWSFKDECYDDVFKCFEQAESEDLGDYPDTVPNQFDNMTGSMNL